MPPAIPPTGPSPDATPPVLADDLDGCGVLITGAGGAIGRAVAVAFAQAGARLVLSDLTEDGLRATADALPAGRPAHLVPANLRAADAGRELLDAAQAALGRIDALVHVAAVIVRRAELADVTQEDWALQEEVNLRATFFLARDAAEAMRADGRGGRIVLFTSQAWWTGGLEGSVAYAATKGGVVSLTRGLARAYAPDGVLVNCVAPGAVDTPMLRDGTGAEALERLRASIPMGRFGRPEEVAGAVLFLASRHASYMTGTTLNVSGGQLPY